MAWAGSGVEAERLERAELAASHGVAASTLGWWRWRLEHRQQGQVGGAKTGADESVGAVKLVRVDVDGNVAQPTPETEVAWELEAPSGHTLRVCSDAGDELLRTAVELPLRGGDDR